VDRAPASGAGGRKFESCRARFRIAFVGAGCGTPARGHADAAVAPKVALVPLCAKTLLPRGACTPTPACVREHLSCEFGQILDGEQGAPAHREQFVGRFGSFTVINPSERSLRTCSRRRAGAGACVDEARRGIGGGSCSAGLGADPGANGGDVDPFAPFCRCEHTRGRAWRQALMGLCASRHAHAHTAWSRIQGPASLRPGCRAPRVWHREHTTGVRAERQRAQARPTTQTRTKTGICRGQRAGCTRHKAMKMPSRWDRRGLDESPKNLRRGAHSRVLAGEEHRKQKRGCAVGTATRVASRVSSRPRIALITRALRCLQTRRNRRGPHPSTSRRSAHGTSTEGEGHPPQTLR
jgi:hypothetical protein